MRRSSRLATPPLRASRFTRGRSLVQSQPRPLAAARLRPNGMAAWASRAGNAESAGCLFESAAALVEGVSFRRARFGIERRNPPRRPRTRSRQERACCVGHAGSAGRRGGRGAVRRHPLPDPHGRTRRGPGGDPSAAPPYGLAGAEQDVLSQPCPSRTRPTRSRLGVGGRSLDARRTFPSRRPSQHVTPERAGAFNQE
jgi:hypothetical protein